MPFFRRLILAVIATAGITAVSPIALAAAQCKIAHSGACASDGAACGAASAHGRCETWREHTWRRVELRCACRVPTPHGSVVVP